MDYICLLLGFLLIPQTIACGENCFEDVCNQQSGECTRGCKPGWHGNRCKKACGDNCFEDVCNLTSGECTKGCKQGWQGKLCNNNISCYLGLYGQNCTEKCSEHCAGDYGNCDTINGHCRSGCRPGWTGQLCDRECQAEKFGAGCKENCPFNCKYDYCNNVNGNCTYGCKPGYENGRGDKCERRCSVGKFGEGCQGNCPFNCKTIYCNHVNGTCNDGCKPGYQGYQCQEKCQVLRFGAECREICPSNCKNGYCNHVNGTCSYRCNPGYEGDKCERSCHALKFGADCKLNCPSNCKYGYCNNTNGNCIHGCEPGYQGDTCEIKCRSGSFGTECRGKCSTTCTNGACSFTNGYCIGGCEAGYQGSMCRSPCRSGSFGAECRKTCSTTCKNGACTHTNGYCIDGCEAGYQGDMCERRCNNGNYGDSCAYRCNVHCKEGGTICRHTDGECLNGCQAGWNGKTCYSKCSVGKYGVACRENCPFNCNNNDCNHVSGICNGGCKPGYQGYKCQEKCRSGSFGTECRRNCSTTCKKSVCNHTNGYCIGGCEDGYQDLMCERKCPSGSFGRECKEKCSTTCNNGVCNHTNGFCIGGCENGYQGYMCERKCRAGKFGIRCQENCPLNCKNDICYHVDGDCSKGCNPGYQGNKCTDRCDNGYYGDKCANQCNTNCNEGDTICRHTDGECLNGCQAGWNGRKCDSKCMPGKFGPGCEENCPLNCNADVCGFVNGNCNEGCKPGFQGNKCNKNCAIGTFGDNCGTNCSGNCVGGDIMCRNIDGHCLNGCQAGWNGTNCFSECDIGFYGENCSSVCGNCKLDNNCDHVNGTCHGGCKTGYSGATCLQAMQGSNSSGVIAGVVLFVIVIIILIIAFIWHKRHSQNKRKDEQSADVELRDDVTAASPRSQGSNKGSRHAKTGGNANTTAGDENIYKNFPMNSPFRNAIPLSNLLPYVKENLANHDSFPKEFQEIPYGMKKASNVAKKSYNREKNRYKDMHAYDETRVVLKTLPKERGSDYINASFIKGHHKDRAYIAAQGPIDESVDDFWRMICEKEIFTIAMVTNLVEEGKTKCQQYWPDVETNSSYGKTSVYTASEIIYSDFTIRNFDVSFEGGPKRNVRQFHFTSWPDKSVPRTTSCLLQFWRKVRKTDENKYHTWLVHCSAGVGRTGTFIALDILYDQGKDKGSVDVYQCVKDLRDQRVNMVQTKDQYVFLHNLMVEALLLFSEPIPLDKLHKAVKDLKTVDQATKKSKHLLLYEALKEDMTVLRTDKAVKEMNSAALLKDNRSKNRFSTVLAGNEFRPILVTHFSGRTNYINAVFMPSYCHKEGYYVTQKPLDNTAIDFCRLLYEKNVKVIVKFPDIEKDHVGVDMSVGPFTLKKKSEEDKAFYTKTVFNMAYKSKDINITQLEFKNWDANQITPVDPENMLHFMHEVELLNRIAHDSPVLVQCLDGSEKSGLFVTLMNIFERAKLDNEVSIPQVIRELRYIRQQIIPNFEQFQFCYDAVLRYIDSHQMYANM